MSNPCSNHYLATVPDISHQHIIRKISFLPIIFNSNQRRNPPFSTGDGKSFRKHTIIAYQSRSDQLIINFLKISYSAIHNSTRLMMLANIIFHALFLIFRSLSKCIIYRRSEEILLNQCRLYEKQCN